MFGDVLIKHFNGGLQSLKKLALSQRGVISLVKLPEILDFYLSPLTSHRMQTFNTLFVFCNLPD